MVVFVEEGAGLAMFLMAACYILKVEAIDKRGITTEGAYLLVEPWYPSILEIPQPNRRTASECIYT
jgi:hypothetical protein